MRRIAVAVLVAAVSGAQAGNFDYDFIELGYHDIEETATTRFLVPIPTPDGDDPGGSFTSRAKGEAISIRGSKSLGERVFVDARWRHRSLDFVGFDSSASVGVDRLDVGAGVRAAPTARTDLVAHLAWIRSEQPIDVYNVAFDEITENGFSVSFGLRTRLTDSLEFFTDVGYEDIVDSELLADVGLRYRIAARVSASLEYVNDAEADGFGVGLRFGF